jgi:hypothetical protein
MCWLQHSCVSPEPPQTEALRNRQNRPRRHHRLLGNKNWRDKAARILIAAGLEGLERAPHRTSASPLPLFERHWDAGVDVRNSPILLQNSDFAGKQNFTCPLIGVAHLRYEGIATRAANRAQEPRGAFSPASERLAPLQNLIDENQAPSRSGVLQQHSPVPVSQLVLGGREKPSCALQRPS